MDFKKKAISINKAKYSDEDDEVEKEAEENDEK